MLKPIAERPAVDGGIVRVLIGMYSLQLLHKIEVHMGRFGSAKGLPTGVCMLGYRRRGGKV